MWIRRGLAATATCVLALGSGSVALAASGGDPNAGDVWTDNVGQPSGPGHEQDPHLACTDINIWGAGLADSSGVYTVDGWPPSGSQETDYTGSWSYDKSKGGTQVVAVISVSKLISTAQANGDAPKNKNGYHFKLDFNQDPQKHKTFWVTCPAPSSPGSSQSPTGQTPSGGSSTNTSGSTTGGSSQTSLNGQTLAGHHHKKKHHKKKHHKKHKNLVKPRRHRRAPKRSVQAVSTTAPSFTG